MDYKDHFDEVSDAVIKTHKNIRDEEGSGWNSALLVFGVVIIFGAVILILSDIDALKLHHGIIILLAGVLLAVMGLWLGISRIRIEQAMLERLQESGIAVMRQVHRRENLSEKLKAGDVKMAAAVQALKAWEIVGEATTTLGEAIGQIETTDEAGTTAKEKAKAVQERIEGKLGDSVKEVGSLAKDAFEAMREAQEKAAVVPQANDLADAIAGARRVARALVEEAEKVADEIVLAYGEIKEAVGAASIASDAATKAVATCALAEMAAAAADKAVKEAATATRDAVMPPKPGDGNGDNGGGGDGAA